MPLQATSGAASYDAFGGGVAAVPNYIEECFSTYLYTGNGSTQTINNGIDLAGEGGLVWTKDRTIGNSHNLNDTARGATKDLYSNLTSAQGTEATGLTAFGSTGYTLGADSGGGDRVNASGHNYVSWAFREQPKFFDVVTFTAPSSGVATINHNLGSVPGCIILKITNGNGSWFVYHRGLSDPLNQTVALNSANAAVSQPGYWTSVNSTSVQLTVGTALVAGFSYVMYVLAHDAGGFGLTGTDNVISCGSYTGTGSAGNAVTLGYEPQWVMIKRTDADGYDWNMFDVMRGIPLSGGSSRLSANTSAAEITGTTPIVVPTATGFSLEATTAAFNGSGGTYIYIAIRRGPMKVPTTGTSVFAPVARTGTGTNPTVVTTGTKPDLLLSFPRTASPSAYGTVFFDKLRGVSQILQSANTNAEATTAGTFVLQSYLNTGFQTGADFIEGYLNYSGSTYAQYLMTRAPGFFDEVCYTGTGSARTVAHNLAAVPELMIVKNRSGVSEWTTYQAPLGASQVMRLNSTIAAFTDASVWNGTAPTSSVFSIGTSGRSNDAGSTFVIYLFASCPGVSKVGSYTGTGTSQTINCGFTSGARFVLIKRTDAAGDWYVWDTARGIVAGNDPYLLLNSTAAEMTLTDFVDPVSTGFELSSTALATVNVSGGTYIFLAIA